ncbi:MAG: phage tail sheath family protein [Bacteroidetes bacterium]|nr:phage tail sheath family protein [Bacteroidota bacterium]
MASTYKTPGVFIEEINLLPATVAQVATGIPAFVGYTEKIPSPNEPVRITSMLEYETIFGGPDKRLLVKFNTTVPGPTLPDNDVLEDVVKFGAVHVLYYCMKMYFNNGGGPCYVVSAGVYPGISAIQVDKDDLITAMDLLEFEDEPTLLVIPEASLETSLGVTGWGEITVAMLAQCAKLQDRFSILDTFPNSDHDDEISDTRDNTGNQNLKYGAVYYPRLNSTLSYQYEGLVPTLIYVELDDNTTRKTLAAAIGTDITAFTTQQVLDYIASKGFDDDLMQLPPSAAIAGVYASVDRTRGVWKAPANVSLSSVISPSIRLTDEEQDGMNVDATSGKSINAIRSFTGKGIMVWGSRTLDGNSAEWRYVPVRRLFIMVEESIEKATQAIVFEPNDANTWLRVKNMCENFLTVLWRQGAFAGATPQQAFFVNCGLGSTMTSQDILDGNLIVDIGVAAVRPAEFIVLRFSHKLQEA